MTTEEVPGREIRHLLASGRKITDGHGAVVLYEGHACPHYVGVPLSGVSEEVRALVRVTLEEEGDGREKMLAAFRALGDTPAVREAMRTVIGVGEVGTEDRLHVALCHHPRCYPRSWSDDLIAAYEVSRSG